MKRISIYFIMLVVALSLSIGVQAKSINVTTAGTLSQHLSSEETQTVTELIISGPLNGTDIALIRTTAGNLEKLDLTNATIVTGGSHYISYNGKEYNTQNNVIGAYMFQGMVNLVDLKLPKNAVGLGSYSQNEYWSGYSVSNCPSLETVTLPSALLWIGEHAFEACSRLKEIIIPEGVKMIGYYAFSDCQSLKKVSLPSTLADSFTYDGCTYRNSYQDGYNFSGCTNLTEVILSEGLTLLYSFMFSNAISIKHITLPSSLKVINSAFDGCKGLLELELPSGLTDLGEMSNCSSLKSLDIPEGVTNVGSFFNCTQLESIKLPSTSYEWLPDFKNCSNLKSISIPDNITVIRRRNFDGCSSLKTVNLSPASKLKTIEYEAFAGTPITEIHLPESVTEIGERAFSDCSQLVRVTLPKNNSAFHLSGSGPFNRCSALKEINLPASLTSIPEYAFKECISLKEIILPGALASLRHQAFAGCTQLTKIIIPGTITSFESETFANSGLKEVTLKNGIREIGEGAFGNTPLTSITFPKTITRISGLGNSNITTILFAEGAEPTEIARYAFQGCKITTFNIPESVTKIEEYAFQSCWIEEITIPETVTNLGKSCFTNCQNLTNVNLPNSMTELPDNFFSDCSKLETIELPSQLNKIGFQTFSNCAISTIILPESLKIIDGWAFNKCEHLKDITFPPRLEKIGMRAFYYTPISNVEIPASVTEIGEEAFWCRFQTTPGVYKEQLNTVVWNPAWEVPDDVFSPTTYLYIPENGSISPNAQYDFTYIFRGGVTNQMAIEENGGQFSIAKELKAKKVYYNKNFNTTSGYNSPAGWKTIVLPFDVEQFTHTKYYTEPDATGTPLAPFGSSLLEINNTALPFWLYELTTTGYVPATTMKANKPYLICMPNNQAYPVANNITGNVRFSAQNDAGVLLSPTNGALQPAEGNSYSLVPTYSTIEKSELIYTLNETESYYDGNKDYPAGSVFIRNYADVTPFQAYLRTKAAPASAPRLYSIGGNGGSITGFENILLTPDKATKAYSKNGVLYIESNAARTIRIYDASGRTIKVIEAQEGHNEVTGLADGIYFLEGQKVMVKK